MLLPDAATALDGAEQTTPLVTPPLEADRITRYRCGAGGPAGELTLVVPDLGPGLDFSDDRTSYGYVSRIFTDPYAEQPGIGDRAFLIEDGDATSTHLVFVRDGVMFELSFFSQLQSVARAVESGPARTQALTAIAHNILARLDGGRTQQVPLPPGPGFTTEADYVPGGKCVEANPPPEC